MEYYSTFKEILPLTTQTNLEPIMLSELSQTWKDAVWSHLYVQQKTDKLKYAEWTRVMDAKSQRDKEQGGSGQHQQSFICAR